MNVVINGIDMSQAKSVLLVTKENLLLDDIMQLKDLLNRNFPDVKFTIVNADIDVVATNNGNGQHFLEID